MRSRFSLTGALATSQVKNWGRRQGGVKSVQSGTGTTTVTAVDTANSVLRWLGYTDTTLDTDPRNFIPKIVLTDSTHVTKSGGANGVVSWTLIEYYPGVIRSIQRGTITLTTELTHTATITAVSARAELVFGGHDTTGSATLDGTVFCKIVLTNTTTVTASIGQNITTAVVPYQVVDWY